MVNLQDLVKRYGTIEAVNHMSLQIHAGEIFGLLGPNGAGKTTALSMIAGLRQPTSGVIMIDGRDMQKERAAIKKIIGVVPQELALYPSITAWDNLLFFGRIYGLGGKLLKQRIQEALAIVGLQERADHVVTTYSGGMKRRLNLACGLLHRPKLLLLDEPTVGVDPQSRNAIFENIRHLNRDWGMTIVYTTHYMEEAQNLCHRVAIVDQGKIRALDSPENLVDKIGGGMIEVTLSQAPPQGITEKVAVLPAVVKTVRHQLSLKLETTRTQTALLSVLTLLQQEGVAVESLRIQEANLESVFLHLTGKSLRDGDTMPSERKD